MIKKLFENAHGHVIIVIVFIRKEITTKNIFQNSSSNWVRYNKYEWRTSTDRKCYITPAADAKPSIYNPIKDYEKLVLTAINIGTTAMNKCTDNPEMMALIMTMKNKPQAVLMSFQREYAESYDWLVEVFRDWAFTFFSSFLYYQDYDKLDENERSLYRQGMAAFGGMAPTYHIELRERPTLVWDFNSLLLCIQMMFSFMLTDDDSSLKVCKHCGKAFAATRSNMEFCSPQCKNQYNVYKSRAKKNNTPAQED